MWLRLRFPYFFAAFVVGIVFCYLLAPAPEVVIKFPTPYNAGKIIYQSESINPDEKRASCFKIDAESVECPMDRSLIKKQPPAETDGVDVISNLLQ